MPQRNPVEALPERQASLVAGLQLHHTFTRAVGKFGAFIEALLGLAVKVFQVGQFRFGVDTLLFQIGQEHAELGAPVAYVVLPYYGVAQMLKYAHHRIADDGGAQMAHVHFLGQVGRGIIDYDLLRRLSHGDCQPRVAQRPVQIGCEPLAVLEEVDKPRSGNGHI